MRFPKPRRFDTVLALVLLTTLVSTDFALYFSGGFPVGVQIFREILILSVVLAFVPLLQKSRFLQNKDVVNKLKGLYVGVAAIYLCLFALKLFLRPLNNVHPIRDESGLALFTSLDSFLFALLFSLATTGILAGVLLILRDLVYFKRRRSSARNFNILLVFIGIQILFANLTSNGLQSRVSLTRLDQLGEMLLYLVIVLMVVNSLRNSWVNYLKKRQKLHCLWLSLPLIVGAVLFQARVARSASFEGYSPSLASAIENVGLFLCIYLGMGFFSILLHLPTAGIFDRKIREIESLHDLSRTLSSVFDSTKIAGMITKKAAAINNSSALWLQLMDRKEKKLTVVSTENLAQSQTSNIDNSTSNGLNAWIHQNKQSVLINEVAKDPRAQSIKTIGSDFNSILGVPLLSQDKLLGILYSAKKEPFGYDEEDRELLEAFANQASVGLENARLVEELVSKQRFEQEIKVARDAQRKLLPKAMPKIAGLDIDAVSVTANEVGGDYYDFFELEQKLGIVVADVSGKGAKAAFYMAQLKGIIEALVPIYASPRELIIEVNRSLYRNLERSAFISLIYVIVDPEEGRLTFTRAGHCPLLVSSRTKGTRYEESKGLGLGLEYGPKFGTRLEERTLKLKKDDLVVLYTDGVIEARNSQSLEYQQERLNQVVAGCRELDAATIKAKLVADIKSFVGGSRYHDDLTFVVMKITDLQV